MFRPPHRTSCIALATLLLPLAGCMQQRYTSARSIASPYPEQGSVLIAVAPARNESGASFLDTASFTASLADHVQSIEGLGVIPMPRVERVMRGQELGAITTPEAARSVARATGADAILVSSVTSWNPYDPPKIGVNAALYTVSEAAHADGPSNFDPRNMGAAWSDRELTYRSSDGPTAGFSEVFNAREGTLRQRIKAWASQQETDESGMGWKRYVKSIGEFTTFVTQRVVSSLLKQERGRVAAVKEAQDAEESPSGPSMTSEMPGAETHQSLIGN